VEKTTLQLGETKKVLIVTPKTMSKKRPHEFEEEKDGSMDTLERRHHSCGVTGSADDAPEACPPEGN